jgi:hypothetical protein
MMKPQAKRGPPVTAAARLGLTIGETEVLGWLAFQMAGADANPLENLESLATTWQTLIEEICPTPSPRNET